MSKPSPKINPLTLRIRIVGSQEEGQAALVNARKIVAAKIFKKIVPQIKQGDSSC